MDKQPQDREKIHTVYHIFHAACLNLEQSAALSKNTFLLCFLLKVFLFDTARWPSTGSHFPSLMRSLLWKTFQGFNASGIFFYWAPLTLVFWSVFPARPRRLHVSSVLFQDAVWPPWVGGVFPARLWAEETARAGCGERGTRRVTFHRNGRSTGLFWRTIACTGTSMRRQVSTTAQFWKGVSRVRL